MSPGPLTTCHRGGNFYAGRALDTSRTLNRAFAAPHGRTYSTPRNKFAVSGNGNGGHSVSLADNEATTLTVNEDGSLVIEVQNKPAPNGTGNGAAVHTEPVENARRTAGRAVAKMSWERNPSDGSVTFYPDEGEVLHVSGDALMANIAAEPVPAPGNLD
jgi:hypothetical protein